MKKAGRTPLYLCLCASASSFRIQSQDFAATIDYSRIVIWIATVSAAAPAVKWCRPLKAKVSPACSVYFSLSFRTTADDIPAGVLVVRNAVSFCQDDAFDLAVAVGQGFTFAAQDGT